MGLSQSTSSSSTTTTNRTSSPLSPPSIITKTIQNVKSNIDDEVTKRGMLQREIQMAVNLAGARDTIQIFGSGYLIFVGGVTMAKIGGKAVPPMVGVPVVVGGFLLGNMVDLAYGNKVARITKEAEYILENERGRFVPMRQAPMARFYSDEEKTSMLDVATPAAMFWPSSLYSRSVYPSIKDETKKKE